jgi:hypothetical protein
MILPVLIGGVVGLVVSLAYISEIVTEWYVHYPLLVAFLVGLSYALQRERTSAMLALVAMSATIVVAIAVESLRN